MGSKIALCNDCHLGVRNDSTLFMSNQIEFLQKTFFPTLSNNGITDLIILGDLFDRRKYINFLTLYQFNANFFQILLDMNINVHILVGNHDTYFKSTNNVNSPELLLAGYKNIQVYTSATLINIDGVNIGLIPWINEANAHDSMKFLTDVKSDIIMGHFEINGFMMNKNSIPCYDGLDKSLFERFDIVYSGHYHEKSNQSNITYLGAWSQYTWADAECVRGFHLFDVKTQTLELIENPYTIFHKITYNDNIDLLTHDFTQYENKVVRLIVGDKPNKNNFELFIEKIRQANPYEFDVVDNTLTLYVDGDKISQEDIDNEDTIGIVNSYIDASNTDLDKNKLKNMFENLHNQVLNT